MLLLLLPSVLRSMILSQSNLYARQASTHSNAKLFSKMCKTCKRRENTNLQRFETSYESKYLSLNRRTRVYLTSFSLSSKHVTALCLRILFQSNICTIQTLAHSKTKLFIKMCKTCKKRGHTNLQRLEPSYDESKYLQLNGKTRVYLISFCFSSKHGTALCLMILFQSNSSTMQTLTHSKTKLEICKTCKK